MCGIANWIVFILLGVASVIDWKKREIPVWLLIFMSIGVLFFALLCKDVSIGQRLAGATLGIVFLLISKITKEAIGYGDSWLILLISVHLGVFLSLQLLFIASFLVAIFAVFFLWKCKWKRSATLPFVPFLTVAYIGVIVG